MTATLTDRYVYAVARSLPEARRDDVERELRATIADDVDARVDGGAPTGEAERAALTALGDPARLVAGYLDRPLHLIGPTYYLAWVRLLRLLAVVVLPIVAATSVLGHLIGGTPPGGIFGATIGLLISVAVHLAFWTAFVFWLMERTKQSADVDSWTVDELPTPPVKGAPPFSDMIASVAFLVVAAVAIVGQQFWSGFSDASAAVIPALEPGLWTWAIPILLAFIAAEIGFAVWLWKAGRWTPAHVVVNIVLALGAAAFVVILVTGPGMYNPEWFAQFGADDEIDPLHIANVVTGVAAVGIGLWDSVDGIVKAIRQRPRRS